MTLKKGWLGRQLHHVTNDVQAWPEWMKREAGFGEYRSRKTESTEQSVPSDNTRRDEKTATACSAGEG